MAKLRVAVLVSGGGTNLQALIDAAEDPGYPARIVLVLSNVEGAYALERARRSGIATKTIDHRAYDGRAAFEAAVQAALRQQRVELICLAGFMRLLTDDFVAAWHDRLINIHPSLLPAFKGAHAHRDALEAGVKISGCTIHFVRPAMDAGPIIAQAAVPVLTDDDEASLSARILVEEHRLYPMVLRRLAEGKIAVVDEKVVVTTPSRARPES